MSVHVVDPVTTGKAGPMQRWAAIVALFAGTTTLVGEVTGTDILTRWIASSTTMNPVTAIMLIVGAVAILLRVEHQRRTMLAVGLITIVVGALKLVQEALGRPLGFDYLVSLAVSSRGSILPDPLALNSAMTLVLLGAALAIGRTTRPRMAVAAQASAIAAIAIALMALVGFTLGAATINQLTFNRMAVNSAVGLAALGMAILPLTPKYGVMRLLVYKGPSGDLARMALPICLAVPILLGVIRLWIQNRFGISTGDGVAIMVAGNITLTLGLLWGCLIMLLRSDAEVRAKAAALAVSEAQYRQAGRIGKMGHWQYDVEHDKLYWTNEFRALLGLNADLAPDFAVMNERIHPDDRDRARDMMIRAQIYGEDWNWHLRLIGADGQIQYARSHGICSRAADGSPQSILGVLADITELELARQGAEAATLAQAAFLANMSHEIRTPLNGVLGFIALLLDSELDSTQRRYLALVDESARMLLKLLNDILDLSKVEAGQLDMAPSATDLRQTVRHAIRLMVPLAEQKSIVLKSNIDSSFPEAVMIDGARFRQILLNILGNALKFTEHGSVAVSLEADHDANGQPVLRAKVSDTGIGIASDRLEVMFKPFVQADSSTSRKFGGSGLGLSISRQLAELMGGTLNLTSIEGTGTNVELVLPLHLATISDAVGHESSGSLAGGGVEGIGEIIAAARARPARSILLVEDLEVNRMLVGDMLGRLGHRVEFAHNGAEALTMAKRLAHDPTAWDLILMDVQMPVMNGNDATRAIRALGGVAATIPIIALSANAFETEIRQSRESGMNDHVVKPIDFGLLSRTIDHWGQSTEPPTAARRRA